MLFVSYAFAGHHIGSDNAYINLYRLLLLILGIAVLKRCHGIFLLEKSVEMLHVLIADACGDCLDILVGLAQKNLRLLPSLPHPGMSFPTFP